jgi:hypothetical protein
MPLLTDTLVELKYNCLGFGKDVAVGLGAETMKVKPGTQVFVCTCTFVIHYVYNKSTTIFGCLARLIGSSDMNLEGANCATMVPGHVPDADF